MLDLLNAKLARPVAIANFRPNPVMQTGIAHVEDHWKRIAIGPVEFDVVKPCTRCILTTIDPDTELPAPDHAPLATARIYRRSPLGVTFGQNLIPLRFGRIAVGMPLSVLE